VTIRIRLAPEDVRALRRARADGIPRRSSSAAACGLPLLNTTVATAVLPGSGSCVTDPHLGEESQLYKASGSDS
jgi:hypothetical protein